VRASVGSSDHQRAAPSAISGDDAPSGLAPGHRRDGTAGGSDGRRHVAGKQRQRGLLGSQRPVGALAVARLRRCGPGHVEPAARLLEAVQLRHDGGCGQAQRPVVGQLVPQTVSEVAGVKANVSGLTAQSKDYNEQMRSRAPLVFAFVLAVAFLLLLVTFRSIVIPLKAIVLNLLSVGAAYGVLVQVFQKGWFESLLGFKSTGAIESGCPCSSSTSSSGSRWTTRSSSSAASARRSTAG
jgi:hypothetical protein